MSSKNKINKFFSNQGIMNKIIVKETGAGYAHASAGRISNFDGKLFMKEAVGATSCEISIGTLPCGASVPFFHSHKADEEIYIILSGAGRFQAGDDVFDISEGSVVRISTGCDRNLKCESEAPMTYICIQARENSLETHTMDDAVISERESLL